MLYWYCEVEFEYAPRNYSYISDIGPIPEDSYVAVHYGNNDFLKVGKVVSCEEYDSENAPYPVEKTKHILHLATEDEYQNGTHDGRTDAEQFDDYLDEDDWDAFSEWAVLHEDLKSKRIIRKVISGYEYFIQNKVTQAAVDLGNLYYNGVAVERDYNKAFELYNIAAEAGDLQAICNLGYCYYYGRDREIDYAQAFHYFETGALVYNDANCLYKLGDMYLHGYHVPKNEDFAYKLYLRARAAFGPDDACFGDIQLRIGKCLLRGIGTNVNIMNALSVLQNALLNFYSRRKTDPFVKDLIRDAKLCIAEAEEILDREII